MKINLDHIVDRVRSYEGLLRKKPIEDVFDKLVIHGQPGLQLPNFGDDAAVIPWKEGFLLLAADGIMTRLLINEPYAAGKAAVMVTVNDIYSMGGRPLAMVNVLASGDENHRAQIIEGIKKGCEKLKVPMVGGHLHPESPGGIPSLAVAILGYANKLLRSHLAESGDDLILAVDLKGDKGCRSVVSWDANSKKTSEELLLRLEALPIIAEKELAQTCKDVSNAGILGTVSIMMENSNKGAVIEPASIPVPPDIELSEWLICFQSFGFVLSVQPEKSQEVIQLFSEREIAASIIG
ncbi:MAG: methanogenesis marker 2 protein, partial [Syntrophaceae bacterium]|nr:methanogenesis marker 2 protein [Syntrophaceae bacterium]